MTACSDFLLYAFILMIKRTSDSDDNLPLKKDEDPTCQIKEFPRSPFVVKISEPPALIVSFKFL